MKRALNLTSFLNDKRGCILNIVYVQINCLKQGYLTKNGFLKQNNNFVFTVKILLLVFQGTMNT